MKERTSLSAENPALADEASYSGQDSLFKPIGRQRIQLTGTSIVAQSILLAPPDGGSGELATRSNHPNQSLIGMEKEIRKQAYQSVIKEAFPPSFFDDSDMHAPYYLHVAYDRENQEPLASARSFSHQEDILREIEGAGQQFIPLVSGAFQKGQKGAAFLAPEEKGNFMVDRMSMKARSGHYRGIAKALLFGLLYRALFAVHRDDQLVFALARVDASAILLAKYIPLGLQIIGQTQYRVGDSDKQHWVLMGDLPRIRKNLNFNCRLLMDIYR